MVQAKFEHGTRINGYDQTRVTDPVEVAPDPGGVAPDPGGVAPDAVEVVPDPVEVAPDPDPGSNL